MLFSRSVLGVDAYVFDVLLLDLVGHDKQPSAFIVYLFLYGRAGRSRWRPVASSLRDIAAGTALSKSAVQSALENLRRRELIASEQTHPTATPRHRVLRPWRARWPEEKTRRSKIATRRKG